MTVPLKTRILLADDHEVVRNGLRMVLDSAPDLEVGAVQDAPAQWQRHAARGHQGLVGLLALAEGAGP